MTPIQSNKTVFFNLSGEPLNGTIYIGQPSTDPRTNAKTVTFRDSGGTTFTASQPLKAVNGRIVYNGLPITALVDGEYSLLMFDSAGNQVVYDPSVTDSGGGGSVDSFSELLRVGLTLDEIKEFDVGVGDTARNIGKALTTDNLGADWLVVSATGNPADDVDLIDFANGLQGRREKSKTYRKDIVQSGQFVFDTPQNIIATTNADAYVGVWTTINISSAVPDNAASATVRISTRASYPNNTISNRLSAFLYVRKTGTTVGTSDSDGTQIASGNIRTDTNETLTVNATGEAVVSLDFGSTSEFDLYLLINDPTSGANNTDPDLSVSVIGYTINARDLI